MLTTQMVAIARAEPHPGLGRAPMENVFTLREASPAMSDTMVDESIPPDRKAPTGTSARLRRRTDCRNSPSRRSTASSSEPPKGCCFASPTRWDRDHQGRGSGHAPSSPGLIAIRGRRLPDIR
jgi:hypothetical protein